MNYPMFQSWLSNHSHTLKTIKIGYLSTNGGDNKHIFDATLFPNLESLTLSRWQMGHSGTLLPFDANNEKLLAPKLRVFGWDFHIYDQHTESWSDFGEGEVAWLRQLAKCASVRKAALKTIEIGFRPWDWDFVEEYPWSRMVSIRDELREGNGIDLVCDTPFMPEGEWLKWRKEKVVQDLIYEEAAQRLQDAARIADSDSESELDFRVERPPRFHGRDIREYLCSS